MDKIEYFVLFVEYHSIDYSGEPDIFVSQPSTYDECLDKKHQALQSVFVKNACICRLTFLD